MNNVKNIVYKLREIIWPLLDPLEKEPEPKQINEKDCKWADKDIDILLEYIEKYYESEEKRSNQIESKSIVFIGTFTVANTLLISLIKDMIFNSNIAHNISRLILISIVVLCIIYLCRSIWFSIKALQRRNYSTMGFPNFMLNNSINKKKQIIICQYNNIQKNHDVINIKVDNMTLAQEYFKRAISTVVIFTLFSFLNYLSSYRNLEKDIGLIIQSINISKLVTIILFVSIILLYILVMILFIKLKNKIGS